MLSNPMLDVAIGLIFLYLLLSIIVTVLQEFLSSFLRLRNANLVKAIAELVGKTKEDKAEFFRHALIAPLFRGEVDDATGIPKLPPAYIPRRNFALAVLDLQSRRQAKRAAAGNALPPAPAPAFALAAFFEDADSGVGLSSRINKFGATATNVIANIQNDEVKKAATSALSAAVSELKTATDVVDTAVKELENLFDSTMDRAAGWYKVNAQRITFVIGVIVALVLNVDTIYVGKQLWDNDELRNRAVATAESFYASETGQRQLTALCLSETTATPVAGGTIDGSAPLDPKAWNSIKECTERELREVTSKIGEVGYPIGWTGWAADGWPQGQPGQSFGWAVVGIVITGLALSLGSSFWFDLLGKFMNVRMTGKREATATSIKSDDRQNTSSVS
ncbi:MAG: hypothetical protein U1E45_11890 [Geminicoccaceae bacterium]